MSEPSLHIHCAWLLCLAQCGEDRAHRRASRLIAASVRKREGAITSDDEVAASLQGVITYANGPSLYSPLRVLPDNPWAIDQPYRVASKAVGVVDLAQRIGQESCPTEHVVQHCQTASLVRWCDESAAEVRLPVSQPLQVSE